MVRSYLIGLRGYFYVCDASRMAHDVDKALHELVSTHGRYSKDIQLSMLIILSVIRDMCVMFINVTTPFITIFLC